MKRSKFPRKLKKAVNTMRANEYRTFPYWGAEPGKQYYVIRLGECVGMSA